MRNICEPEKYRRNYRKCLWLTDNNNNRQLKVPSNRMLRLYPDLINNIVSLPPSVLLILFFFGEYVFNYILLLFQICPEGNRIAVLQPEDHQLPIQLKFKRFSMTIPASYNKFKSFKAWAKQTNA